MKLAAPHPWVALLASSLLGAGLFHLARLPAPLFLGGMMAGLLIAWRGAELRLPPGPLALAQALIGCLIARSWTPEVVATVGQAWPWLLASVGLTLAASVALAWALGRGGRVLASTAIWGMLPGGSIAMMLLAEEFGADAPLVAFIQNLRLMLVATLASVIAALARPTAPPPFDFGGAWLAPVAWPALGLTLALVALCLTLARWWPGLPAGNLLLPMAIGGALQGSGLMQVELPPWLLGPSFLLLGWSVGLRFTRDSALKAAHALPHVLLAILGMVAWCGGLAWALVAWAGVAPLTAYLATSPGGADSVAIVAAASPVDLPFVMTLQSVRVLVILLLGPALARWVARRFLAWERPAQVLLDLAPRPPEASEGPLRP